MSWHLLAAATAVAASLTGASAQLPVEAAGEPEVLELDTERWQRMTVPVTIQEQGPFRFMIDTGAEATVLSRDLADRLQLHDRDTAVLVGMASRVPIETVGIQGLTLGSRSFFIQSAALVDSAHLGSAQGILGLDSLQDQRVLLDFENMTMAVADADELGGNRGFEIVVKARERLGQLIITRAFLDGVRTAVIIDTGAQSSVGNPALLERLRRRARGAGDSVLTDVNGNKLAGKVRIAKDLKMGRVQINSFAVLFADCPPFHELGLTDEPALILGMRELRAFRRVAIDFESRTVLFDLPRGVYEFDSLFGRRLGVG